MAGVDVGDAEARAVLHEAPRERVLADEHRCVEVGVGKGARAGGQVGRAGHGENALHHAADHEREAGAASSVDHGQCFADARFHRLDVHAGGDTRTGQLAHIVGAAGRLIGAQWNGAIAGQCRPAATIRGRQGLLE